MRLRLRRRGWEENGKGGIWLERWLWQRMRLERARIAMIVEDSDEAEVEVEVKGAEMT